MQASDRPAHINLASTDFETPSQREAAREIVRLWPETRNAAEIARQTGWSASHIRNVIRDYFAAADSAAEAAQPEDIPGAPDSGNEAVLPEEVPEDVREAYRAGYQQGFQDGFERGRETGE